MLLLIGLCVVLFAGYAITLRGRRLQPRKVVTMLGERQLLPGKPAAFRLVGWDLKWERPLAVSRVDLELERKPGPVVALARLYPKSPVVDLNARLPDWPKGPATLRARVDTELGETVLEARVELDPGVVLRLRLVPPSVELKQAPVFIQSGTGAAVEGGGQAGAPAGVKFFPLGGSVSNSYPTRILVQVVDRSNRPAPGALRVGEQEAQPADGEGFVEVVTREGGSPGRLKLSFEGEDGRLDGEAWLQSTPAQIDAAVGSPLAPVGRPLVVGLRTLSPSAAVYLDAWWSGGWCYSGGAKSESGRAVSTVDIPAGIEGPLVIRARSDPFGQGSAVRDVVVLTGRERPPTHADGLAQLRRLPAEEGFWNQARGIGDGPRGLQALLSRVRAPGGPLPELVDSRDREEAAIAERKADLIAFGRGMVAITSGVIWLAVAGLLLAAVRKTQKEQRKRSLVTALIALVVCGVALGAGLFWLFLLGN
ncbi:hypothetical protein ACFL2F_04860 [Myxococcota bacterium]